MTKISSVSLFPAKDTIKKLKSLKPLTLKILERINIDWPTNPLDIAKQIGDTGSVKSLSSRYLYHLKKLHNLELINMKKIGNTYIAWPIDMEKLRVIHELLLSLIHI